MNADQLIQLTRIYKENREYITNEETAKKFLVDPLIKALGYNLPKEVRLEYSAEFTQGDGKRFPDRMDYAIFDQTGKRPLIVIETKLPNSDIKKKSMQLARYLSQMPDLHFGILSDGCTYNFYGDLKSQNVMDDDPFFSFSLDDPKTDWEKVASFLSKFSRDSFNAETLITDAENSRYRQAMTEKLVRILRNPSEDKIFMSWLTKDIYTGKRTNQVMTRMSNIAKEAIEPALLRVLGDDLFEKLKERWRAASELKTETSERVANVSIKDVMSDIILNSNEKTIEKKGIVTTEDELKFYEIVKDICTHAGYDSNKIIFRDTINYFNISYEKPTKWFLRFFGDAKRKHVTTLVPTNDVQALVKGFEIEDSPPVFGISRIFIGGIDQLKGIESVILQSLKIVIGEAIS